jgi:hypothetical protein
MRLAAEYNAQVENYKQIEQVEITKDPVTDVETLELSNAANYELSPLYDEVFEQIGDLNQAYWEFYQQDHQQTSLPMSMTKDELQEYKDKIKKEFDLWVEDEQENGSTVKLYNPEDEIYYVILVGESDALYRSKWEYITRVIALSNAPSKEILALDIQRIKTIDTGRTSIIAVSAYPYYRFDIDLTQYETEKAYYLMYSDLHVFIEIIPKQTPPTSQEGSLTELEVKAREWVALLSPGLNFDNLTPIQDEKVRTYFFRWENQTRPFLDDGKSYPFIQVALNGNGELLNYYNTLPLAR